MLQFKYLLEQEILKKFEQGNIMTFEQGIMMKFEKGITIFSIRING